ncbi:hypothetical protein G6F46_000748 [Rhizopus delemar]|uniref:Yeast cell wall synthesis Kre9/Knh1-like N-terminal domain-containing protein n=3 Tax=Rhizopus TaxID=4842 RepID=I1CMD6_RHIO9|nr:hypothetical protein RO3G_14327 [Rhizopus delemar RA 99-880]KAG1050168.1 hypothetical protein G6F43_007542 [Rhizopus delemar]KAG1543608.1 hypothetical protein G6F51_006567 [Rhizopus arrhizus]KAG1460049.1 hypothetical protein G6F55_004396 [Rhizopus delemar]KAG1501594.1 hypothetical protein G6F54_002934 [Rhizopus delemar]|eukprot:EIE89616.1 hypothetical protein RO3G_14327 [Rhizopus delemar RA 99-880]
MKSVFATLLAVAATVVSAQTNIVSITSPLTGTVYTAGQSAIISWINPQVSSISKIVLAQGDPTALQPVSTIAENVDASAGSYTWNIPADITPANNYALELGTSPNVSYTALFTIQAGSGSSSSAAASSAASSSTSLAIGNGAASVTSAVASVASSATSAAASATSAAASAASSAASSISSSASSAISSAASSATSSAAAQASSTSSGFKVSANQAAAGVMAVVAMAIMM